ncbi:clp protease proteolytic subunit (chloroplast) [Solanum lycopersicum]|uniref:ATP-dependent Clp protease proteolytic subunit n=6 Tax=Solanum subgen. Lycopersicon TaxID=49274 RepID=CLPP_SOLLC|nr:clp protease proteolytic subunit [Solanum lycopersicum]YP_009131737.1 clp protease proteolytic subunit [Solanum cheesmaniae]YP_009131903.1 clp protease proteolytic subunit [Solanum galapagense]YP_009131986.1 clp protease proteolytic subunit [Solanum habrochaites]YP_009132235.1 clp protease proteolytic subunit [Solanum pimpinellifolium]AP_004953.1 ATP-dependent Clp protease proteolytic subunit [Solanum lycopersicum]Q2MI76.1 RecName: Full=ATP-dependent Clp protease proteolytic subunit; AltNa
MPIGVPRVVFRNPGDPISSWVDIYNRLYRERLLFLGQGIGTELSNQLIGLMLYLSMEDENKDLYLFVNSPGGWVIPGIAIYDTMQFVRPDIHTICLGLAASMGSFILAGGQLTKRIAFPHARVMIHEPYSGFYMAQVGEFVLEAIEMAKLRETLTRVYAEKTGQPVWVIHEDMERDIFMSATEAQAYGIVDFVAVQGKEHGFHADL